jgi:hypothetical protein
MKNDCIKIVKMKVECRLDKKKKIQLRETNVRRRRGTGRLIKGLLMDIDSGA